MRRTDPWSALLGAKIRHMFKFFFFSGALYVKHFPLTRIQEISRGSSSPIQLLSTGADQMV